LNNTDATGNDMITENQAIAFAEHWVQAWNSHDLDAIVSHYEDDVVLVSPNAR